MLKSIVITAVAVVFAGGAAFAQPTPPAATPDVRFVDFPSRIDPHGTHKHVAMRVGSVLFARRDVVAHETLTGRDGHAVDMAYPIDAESSITRLPGETLIVEPDGTTWHLSPTTRIDRSGEWWRHIVIPPGNPIPAYLRASKPDIDLR
jgi:hypothetical protein